jgi:hypothetical protein
MNTPEGLITILCRPEDDPKFSESVKTATANPRLMAAWAGKHTDLGFAEAVESALKAEYPSCCIVYEQPHTFYEPRAEPLRWTVYRDGLPA